MRLSLLPLVALSATVSAQLVVPFLRGDSVLRPLDRDQVPLMDPAGPGPAIPPSDPSQAEPPSGPRGGVVLSDVMGRDRSINLFAGYVHGTAGFSVSDDHQLTVSTPGL
jgi:paired amphipathic helix protein Sin3a